jgi:hypothetical protein
MTFFFSSYSATKIVVNIKDKAIKLFSLSHFLKTTHVEHHVKSRSRIALRLQLHQNDAAPCGSGSATLVCTML